MFFRGARGKRPRWAPRAGQCGRPARLGTQTAATLVWPDYVSFLPRGLKPAGTWGGRWRETGGETRRGARRTGTASGVQVPTLRPEASDLMSGSGFPHL